MLPLRTEASDALMAALDDPVPAGVVLTGPPGSGKSTILRLAREELGARGRSVFLLSLTRARDTDLSVLIAREVVESIAARAPWLLERFGVQSLPLRLSTGSSMTREATTLLHAVAEHLNAPVLMLDDFDALTAPERHARVIDELSHDLPAWHIVVSTRSDSLGLIRGLRRFRILEVPPMTPAEASELLRRLYPDRPDPELRRAVELGQGNPLMLRLLWEEQRALPSLFAESSLSDNIDTAIDALLDRASDQPGLLPLLDYLALSDGPQPIAVLVAVMGVPVDDLRRLIESSAVVRLIEHDEVVLIHEVIRKALLARRVLTPQFCLADLEFGTEEAETDSRLEESYVSRSGVDDFLQRRRTIVVGDRGSGKSAMFRKLCAEHGADVTKATAVLPLRKPQELLYRIVVQEREPTSADDFRAAWLLLVAWVVAGSMPEGAPRALGRTARQLRSTLIPSNSGSRRKRMLRTVGDRLSGAKMTLAVGPVNLGLSGGAGSPRHGRSLLDINDFLRDYDEFLGSIGSQVTVPIDRVDEAFKYERMRQQALVQGLFGAEKEIHELSNLRLAVLIRTDLFETFQIEEKNKLVTRTLVLDWSEDDWIRLLVNRVLVNRALENLLPPLTRGTCLLEGLELSRAVEALFPEEVEDLPAETWLFESIRNGNGDLQPRLAILLLVLASERAEDPEALVSDLPLFSGQALSAAMSELSRLCYAELVNDFQIAPEFVRNCRAAKLRKFDLPDVHALFSPEDGPINEQVRLLERVGFLERVVDQKDPTMRSHFRIPALYARSWVTG